MRIQARARSAPGHTGKDSDELLEATSCPVLFKPFDLLSLARQIAELDQAA
ncbi:MAG TPA: hypothetical protein VNO19_04255 [Gemmatimonadales bacterium]|nr:hypothetical protein [Gemmatimonadales bacterium]